MGLAYIRRFPGVILEIGDRDKGVVLNIDRANTNKSRKSVEIIKCPMVSGGEERRGVGG